MLQPFDQTPRFRKIGVLALFWIVSGGTMVFATEPEVAVIDVYYRDAAELESAVRGVLSPRGAVTTATTANVLIINDYPANISAARKLVKRLDPKPVRIMVTVTGVSPAAVASFLVDLSFSAVGPGWQVAVGKGSSIQNGVPVNILDRVSRSDRKSVQQVTLMANGTPATLFVGSEHPVTTVTTSGDSWGSTTTSTTWFEQAGEKMNVSVRSAGEGWYKVWIAPESSRFEPDGSRQVARSSAQLVVAEGGEMVLARSGWSTQQSHRSTFGEHSRSQSVSDVLILTIATEQR
jgi:type II secretory pathway component GspD/PulD (secretin)